MFRKNKKQTETIKEPKEKKVRTFKVGTHKKSVIALWVVLIASVSFGAYKNFTAIDQHTTHEKEIIELRLQDTNGIENFVKNFAKPYYTWSNSKEAIEARTQAISGYLTKELQDLNVDTIRTDIPTSSTVTDVIVWSIEQSGTDTFSATYEVDQQIKEGEQTSNVKATYTVKVFLCQVGTKKILRIYKPFIGGQPPVNGLRFLYALLPFFVRRFLYAVSNASIIGVTGSSLSGLDRYSNRMPFSRNFRSNLMKEEVSRLIREVSRVRIVPMS